MKRLMIVMLALVFVVSAVALAGGDQNRGDKGQGDVVQNQERLCPDCGTPVGPNCPVCPECGCPQPPCGDGDCDGDCDGDGDQDRQRNRDGSCND